MNFHIREIRENELDIIHSLEEDIYDTPWSCSFFKLMAKLEKYLFLVAVNDNLIVGYTVGEVESASWSELGRVSCNQSSDPRVKYTTNSYRLHQIAWGTLYADEKFDVPSIVFKYQYESSY